MKTREQIEKMYWDFKANLDLHYEELDNETDPDKRQEIFDEMICIREKTSLLSEILDG